MTTYQTAVETAIGQLREGFQADGADLELVEVTEDTVRVRLIVTAETCLDCIVPGPLLHQVIESTVQDAMPTLRRLELDDPRSAA